jgi:hypothetical protein
LRAPGTRGWDQRGKAAFVNAVDSYAMGLEGSCEATFTSVAEVAQHHFPYVPE